MKDLLDRLDESHAVLAAALGKGKKDTIYSEAAAEIRRLRALLEQKDAATDASATRLG